MAAVNINSNEINHCRDTASGVFIMERVAKATTKLWITIRIYQIDQPVPLFGFWDDFFLCFLAIELLQGLDFFRLRMSELYPRFDFLGVHLTVELFYLPNDETKDHTRHEHYHPEGSKYLLVINLGGV